MRRVTKLALIPAVCVLMSSCTAAIIGGGVAGGYVAAKHEKEISEYSSDSWITSKVKSKYLAEHGLRSLNVSVSTDQGVVYLNGSVKNHLQQQTAITLAQNTKGVKRVDAENLMIHQ